MVRVEPEHGVYGLDAQTGCAYVCVCVHVLQKLESLGIGWMFSAKIGIIWVKKTKCSYFVLQCVCVCVCVTSSRESLKLQMWFFC